MQNNLLNLQSMAQLFESNIEQIENGRNKCSKTLLTNIILKY